MGYVGGEVRPGRCEDFPACGHTDGDPCPQPDEVAGTPAYEARIAVEQSRAAQDRAERQADLERRAETCGAAFMRTPETHLEPANLYRRSIAHGLVVGFEHEHGRFPTVTELGAILAALPANADSILKSRLQDEIVECHEDDARTGFKACRNCVQEWDAEAEIARENEMEFI